MFAPLLNQSLLACGLLNRHTRAAELLDRLTSHFLIASVRMRQLGFDPAAAPAVVQAAVPSVAPAPVQDVAPVARAA